jgi:deazaflavin-dependent oxidoreductase (nitroreductase family)
MSDYNAGIIEEFRANEGRVGGRFEGYPLILIHHVGARTCTKRVTPVGCFPRSDVRFVIVASNGGAQTNPDWYYNLKTHPVIAVEFGTEVFVVKVRELEGEECERAWAEVVDAVPAVANTQNETMRTIPVLLLTRMTRHERVQRPVKLGWARETDHD